MILPLAGDAQVPRRDPEPDEPVALQHPLRPDVVRQRPGLHAVQAELPEGQVLQVPERCDGEPSTV